MKEKLLWLILIAVAGVSGFYAGTRNLPAPDPYAAYATPADSAILPPANRYTFEWKGSFVIRYDNQEGQFAMMHPKTHQWRTISEPGLSEETLAGFDMKEYFKTLAPPSPGTPRP